jgi:phosphoribosylaminoimidazole-succinocarboxamide synthase
MPFKYNIAIFSSGAGTTAKYIADNYPSDNGKVVLFIENNEHFNNIAGWAQPRFQIVPVNWVRNDYSLVLDNLAKHQINLVFLAGWMHICPSGFLGQLEAKNIEIVNLHPTLPYQLIGRDIHPKIWSMYQEGMTHRTGAMVHRVSSDVDRGEVIATRELDLRECPSYDDYLAKMRGDDKGFAGIEKLVCLDAITRLAADFHKRQSLETFQKQDWQINLTANDFSLVHRGKVRDSYVSRHYPDWLFINTTDRVSANDIILTHVRTKGHYLNQINQFWHRLFGLSQLITGTQSGMMVVRRFQPIPLEFIIRNKLWGSMWSAYQSGQRDFNGMVLPDGLEKGSVFPSGPIFTPTTKGKKDRPITEAEILSMGLVSKNELAEIRTRCLELFKQGADYLSRLGIEMIDTKFEMAFDAKGGIHFIDEIFTPDSSRFIILGQQMDKDALRKWVSENEQMILELPILSDGTRVGLELPQEIANGLANNYQRFYELITMGLGSSNEVSNLPSGEMLPTCCAILIAGSEADWAHIAKLRQELAARGILAVNYFSSAHKRTLATMEIINKWNTQAAKKETRYVFITCAGMSNALSGVVAANSRGIPVIACPPAKDLDDQQTNINSTLQMPSAVPAACILRPDNVAGFCVNIL